MQRVTARPPGTTSPEHCYQTRFMRTDIKPHGYHSSRCHSVTGQKSHCVNLCDAICLTSKDQSSNVTMNALRPIQHCDTTLDHSHKTEMENATPLASSFGLWYRAGRSENSQVQSWLIHVLMKNSPNIYFRMERKPNRTERTRNRNEPNTNRNHPVS